MKWFRLFLLLLALTAPLGPKNCHADMLPDDNAPEKPARNPDQEIDNGILLSIAGSIVVVALGTSFIALRRSRKKNDDPTQ